MIIEQDFGLPKYENWADFNKLFPDKEIIEIYVNKESLFCENMVASYLLNYYSGRCSVPMYKMNIYDKIRQILDNANKVNIVNKYIVILKCKELCGVAYINYLPQIDEEYYEDC